MYTTKDYFKTYITKQQTANITFSLNGVNPSTNNILYTLNAGTDNASGIVNYQNTSEAVLGVYGDQWIFRFRDSSGNILNNQFSSLNIGNTAIPTELIVFVAPGGTGPYQAIGPYTINLSPRSQGLSGAVYYSWCNDIIKFEDRSTGVLWTINLQNADPSWPNCT